MSYYIEADNGAFISGFYASQVEAEAAIQRYINQASKRYTQQDMQHKERNRLRQSLNVVRNNANSSIPSWVDDELAIDIYLRIAGNSVGTIYTRPLLIDMTRTRIIGTKGEYWEVTPQQRERALTKLFSGKTAPLVEDSETGTITRTKYSYTTVGSGKQGLYKTYMQRI